MDLCEVLFEFGRAQVALKRALGLLEQAESRGAQADPDLTLRADAGLGLALARVVRAEARALAARAEIAAVGYTAAA